MYLSRTGAKTRRFNPHLQQVGDEIKAAETSV